MQRELQQSIVKTLTYFDLFHHPLTREELFRFLFQPPRLSYDVFCRELGQLSTLLDAKPGWQTESGWYFLPGSSGHVVERQASQWYGKEKLRIAGRAARLARYIPFLRAFFVCNQLPVGTKDESDIDVFIITTPGRLWLVRFLTSVLFTLFGLRRSGFMNFLGFKRKAGNKDNLCLSFYVSTDSLDLRAIAVGEKDIYLAYWLTQLIPLYDPENLYQKVQSANGWAELFLPNAFLGTSLRVDLAVKQSVFSWLSQKIGEVVGKGKRGEMIENFLAGKQKQRLQKKGVIQDSQNIGVVISPTMLKFHEHDRRQYYFELWQARVQAQTANLSSYGF